MYFKEFLDRLKTKKNCTTHGRLFSALGGEKKLQMKERRWLQIASGQYPPPTHLLASLFGQVDTQDQKDFIASFLNSSLEDGPGKKALIDYLGFEIRPARQRAETSPWERPFQFYNDEQLELLTEDSKAFHLYKRVFLLEDQPLKLSDIKKDSVAAKKLIENELLEWKGGVLTTVKKRYRIPRYETHGSRTVALANKYIASHFDRYVSWEGAPKQSLEFVAMTVEPSRVPMIQKEATEFRHWLHSQALEDPAAEQVPMACVIFVKELKRSEV